MTHPEPAEARNLLEGLNPAQREAVEAVDGPLLIVAGPGSGKTRVITHRIAYLVEVHGVTPHSILAMTFTNKAAREMRDRLSRLVGFRSDALTVGTFHSFCARLLRREAEHLGISPNYSIFDDDDQMSAIRKSLEMADYDPKRYPPRAVLATISKAKSTLLDSQGMARQATGDYFQEVCARVYRHYEEILARNNALDFDDLLLRTVQLFRDFPAVLQRYQQRYTYLMVDEFQGHQRLPVPTVPPVGPGPPELLRRWRPRPVHLLLAQRRRPQHPELPRRLPPAPASSRWDRTTAPPPISSTPPRASSPPTVSASTTNCSPRTPPASRCSSPKPTTMTRRPVRSSVKSAVSPARRTSSSATCAVMYRVNAQSRALEEACISQGMKYRLVGGTRFYQRKEIKDLAAYLRLLYNPQDDVNLSRVINVPPRGLGAKSLQQLGDLAASQSTSLYQAAQTVAAAHAVRGPCPAGLSTRAAASVAKFTTTIDRLTALSQEIEIVKLIDLALEESGLRKHIRESDDRPEERWENVLAFRDLANEFNAEEPPDGLAALLERTALVSQVDEYEDAEDSLTLITLHQAKGLEFPVVFIVGLEEGILPHSRSMDSADQLEEERRLCYVGMTRARQKLYLLRAFRRGFRNGTGGGPAIASRFLREIPEDLVSSTTLSQSRADSAPEPGRGASIRAAVLAAASAAPPQLPSLRVGDTVRHRAFGEGVVTAWEPTSSDVEVTVEFARGVGAKRLLLSFAPLEKLDD